MYTTEQKKQPKKAPVTIVGVIRKSAIKYVQKSNIPYNEGRLVVDLSCDPNFSCFGEIAITVDKDNLKFTGMIGEKIEAKVYNRTYTLKNKETGSVKDFCNEMRAINIQHLPK